MARRRWVSSGADASEPSERAGAGAEVAHSADGRMGAISIQI